MSEVPLYPSQAAMCMCGPCRLLVDVTGKVTPVILHGTCVPVTHPKGGQQCFNLKQRIYKLVLESQLPHKTFNSMFYFTIVENKLTIIWGS